ncbi:phenylalanine--tRNA ligase subunit beta [Candidatus Kaiserbacteria bacterium]|nr:phenylalanine--tRNA ligase subunit beta [Candidatus Kaiserbacteria bacterium]
MTTPTSYNWLKDYLGDSEISPTEVADLLGAHAFEIEDVKAVSGDTVIEVDILPNRSSDCLCHRGIARELASITGKPLANDPLKQELNLPTSDLISVEIEDPEACPRFTASLITGITVKESPAWLKERLQAIGQRSINNIVDATNYVMYAIGQPTHAYDADLFPQVDGQWKFMVRYAKVGEMVSLLAESGKSEDRDVEMKGSELLIVDNSSNTPIGLAGVKGGRFAGVHEGTTKVIIEAAHFHPTLTRKTARRLGIVIDASKRFENEPARELPSYAQAEIIKLIKDIAGGECEGVIDEYLIKSTPTKVTVSIKHTNALLGLELNSDEIEVILKKIGAEVTKIPDGFEVISPWERTDLNIEEDYIEEIGRLYGYDHIKSVMPDKVPLREINRRHYYSERIRKPLIALGFSEVITSSFRNKDTVQLQNALASDKTCLRSSLGKNLNEALDKNAGFTDLLGTMDTRIFEIGTVFDLKDGGGITEHVSLAIGVRVKPSGYSGKEDKILNEAILALEEVLETKLIAKPEKGVVEIDLTELVATLPEVDKYETVEKLEDIQYKSFSIYPAISRDIAMWVSEDTGETEVETVLNETAGDLRVRTTLFDVFVKDGRKSIAFRLVFQANDRTLTDAEVGKIMDGVYEAVAKNSWEVR